MTLVWHDWFATSNDGVGSQQLMLRQNALLPPHALGTFATCCSTSRTTRRCCSGSRRRTTEGRAERELRARVMELFTLGAGSGYASATCASRRGR
jgi:uncharacterized protein (DUF1800 family)